MDVAYVFDGSCDVFRYCIFIAVAEVIAENGILVTYGLFLDMLYGSPAFLFLRIGNRWRPFEGILDGNERGGLRWG